MRRPSTAWPVLLLLLALPPCGASEPAEDQAKAFYEMIEVMAPEARLHRQQAADALIAASPQAAPKAWQRTLAKKRDALEKQRQRFLAPKAMAVFVAKLQPEMDKRRAAAIALIRDEAAYPYPNKSEAAQQRVDALVDEVRAIWDDPLASVAKQVPELVEHLPAMERATADLQEIDGYLARYPGKAAATDAAAAPAASAADAPGSFADAFNRAVRAAWQPADWLAIRDANRQAPYLGDEERIHIEVLNDYRAMLGIAPLECDVRLYLAAQGHSRDMAEKGFFAHVSPVPGKANPTDRVKLEGYGVGSGGGENIHMGSPSGKGAFTSWYHSSGHHRNMIAGYTQIGAARIGRHWTQNFGGEGPFTLSKGAKPAMVAYLEQAAATSEEASAEQRLALAERAAALKLWAQAKQQLERVLVLDAGNAKAKAALKKVEGMLAK